MSVFHMSLLSITVTLLPSEFCSALKNLPKTCGPEMFLSSSLFLGLLYVHWHSTHLIEFFLTEISSFLLSDQGPQDRKQELWLHISVQTTAKTYNSWILPACPLKDALIWITLLCLAVIFHRTCGNTMSLQLLSQ